MEVKAIVKNAIITPRKARMMINLVRGKTANEAIGILNFTPHKSARIVKKLIESAVANASHNYGINKDNLVIKTIEAQDGLVMKRWMPRAHGHANPILKRRSHISVSLDEITKTEGVKESRKSKMKTFSYEEVKKVMKEAEKASKLIKDKQVGKEPAKTEIQKGEKIPQKEIDNRPRFSRLGDTFKRLIHRTTKKG